MNPAKMKKLAAAGWRVGSVREFLQLTDEEEMLVEIRVTLSRYVRERRAQQGLTQTQLAQRLGSSQSRIAKLEAADADVSLDLVLRALLALGATRKEIGRAFSG
jgi:ribosome-binding protein aMBF1 (putative translation factor)